MEEGIAFQGQLSDETDIHVVKEVRIVGGASNEVFYRAS